MRFVTHVCLHTDDYMHGARKFLTIKSACGTLPLIVLFTVLIAHAAFYYISFYTMY